MPRSFLHLLGFLLPLEIATGSHGFRLRVQQLIHLVKQENAETEITQRDQISFTSSDPPILSRRVVQFVQIDTIYQIAPVPDGNI